MENIWKLVLFVVLAWLTTLIIGLSSFSSWSERGQFGDLFGAVNSLFSGLAFVGLITTIRMQVKEIDLQREELKLQREEMKAMREEQAKSSKAQGDLVVKQVLNAQIGALSALTQARYQYANSFGSNAREFLKGAEAAEIQLIDLLEVSGFSVGKLRETTLNA